MSRDSAGHWETMYEDSNPTELSWFEPVPSRSLALIQATGLPPDAPLLDVGGGASSLVDHLLAAGYTDVSVLDIAPAALAQVRARLGPAARRVEWIVTDVTAFQPKRRYAMWHDRAVVHFLTAAAERERYLAVLTASLAPGGHVVLATFGPQGPTRCSGLPVQRYSADDLGMLLGTGFRLRRTLKEDHRTPAGGYQQFVYTWWQAAA